jgi:hypothetical protein
LRHKGQRLLLLLLLLLLLVSAGHCLGASCCPLYSSCTVWCTSRNIDAAACEHSSQQRLPQAQLLPALLFQLQQLAEGGARCLLRLLLLPG